ncbi:hypothetical protein E8L90_26900 [Brevibacillus antibioticus]|uniref:Uncharacterized protein n=1 Tax=Brevibacillus antibioticus TaxID=2570228 RepID=A0A4V6X5Y3_9BACL|nr:hypothetical protein [Brevibacillus antibioticus]TKI58733.1 hypothetical protein E8L90_26900 [Brevibacillus antibioticus]
MKKFAATGLLALTLVLVTSASAFAAVYPDNEPNNSRDTANTFHVADGNQINGNLDRHNGDHQDYFKFTPATNQKVRFQIAYSKANKQEFKLVLLGKDETTLNKDYFDVQLEAGREYTLRVEGHSYDLDNNNFNYSVYTYVLPN